MVNRWQWGRDPGLMNTRDYQEEITLAENTQEIIFDPGNKIFFYRYQYQWPEKIALLTLLI